MLPKSGTVEPHHRPLQRRLPLTSLREKRSRLRATTARQGLVLVRVPHGADEGDLVHKVRKVVEQVQGRTVDAPQQVTEEVAQRVDAPADGDDVAHGLEGLLHVLARARERRSALPSLADENLGEDKAPAG